MRLLCRPSICCGLKQFVRYRSQRRSLGKPPGVASSLQDRLANCDIKDPNVHYKVDIGFALPAARRKQVLTDRVQILKQNREKLESAARNGTLSVPLDEVRREWNGQDTRTAAEHYAVYEHLFGDAYFTPALKLHVTYEGGYSVYRGNLVTPSQAKSKPQVQYTANPDTYWTLALTTPDGHLTSHSSEYLLWLVGNIRGNAVDSGEELASYLQPFPLKGIGFCRYIFILYKQEGPIDYKQLRHSPTCENPSDRNFSTYDFYSSRQDLLTPAGLSFFQAEWDESVHSIFHKVFNSPDPVCSYDFPPPYHPKQQWFPKGKAFNLYMDRYRDQKTIAKEHLVKKLRDYDPWTGFPPSLQFPNAVPFTKSTPSWLRNEMRKQRRGLARYKDH